MRDSAVRTARRLAVGTALLALPVLAVPSTPAYAAPPPACVTLTKNATATVLTVRNNCTTPQRVRVVLSETVVGACSLYAPGAVRVISASPPAPSARLDAC